MSVKGKIYGKYLKRAKYVVKGKKLKSPIATIQKRELGGKPKTETEYAGKTVYNNVTPSVNKTSVGTVQSKVQMAKKNGNDISFSELGKKIVEGEDNTKGSKRDSKTLMFVIVSLAIIIVAGMLYKFNQTLQQSIKYVDENISEINYKDGTLKITPNNQ